MRVGPFSLDESVGLDELMAAAKESRAALARYLKPLDRALSDLAELRMDTQLSRRVAHGHTPGPADLSRLRAPPYPRGRLHQQPAQVRVAGFGDTQLRIVLAGLAALGPQSQITTHIPAARKALRISES